MSRVTGYYKTDTGRRDLGTEKMISLDVEWIDVVKQAIDLKAHLVVKSSYVSENRPGHWYIKGFKNKKTYDEIKAILDNNQLNGKCSTRESWLIKHD